VKVLFDNNMPRQLRRSLSGHEVRTAGEMLWALLENGDLLRAAEDAGFDVMVTGDKNLSYQQNLAGRKLALVVLSTNSWKIIQQNTEVVVLAVNAATTGSFDFVTIPPLKTP